MRYLLTIVGAIIFAFGILFSLQGSGFVHWPSDSFMLDQQVWVIYGLMTALAGAAIILIARRIGR
jgi:hypothetical protein